MPIFDSDKEINARYRSCVDDIILLRVRVIASVGGIMYLFFNVLDWVTYPTHAILFLKIRSICVAGLFIILLLSFWKRVKPLAVWLSDAVGMFTAAGIILMIFLVDGSSSHYYEGLNIVFLGVGIMNAFYPKHNILSYLTMLAFYELAVFNDGQALNIVNLYSANFFMVSTAFLVIVMGRLYSAQHRQGFLRQEQLDQLSNTDELTKIHNRRSFFVLLENKIQSSDHSNSVFYLAIFDVDHFKELNDRWGHPFGDLALTKVTEIVKSNIRTNDCLGRFGGDEFVLFLDIADADMLMQRLTKISQGVTSLNLKQENQSVLISVSIGAAKFIPGQNMTADAILDKADQQLLMVKKTNRGQICIAE